MINPKLALIPSAYKASKIYSVLPANGDGDFAFSRSSTATRTNKDGLVERVAVNIPRLDYANGNCPELLLERPSTNLCLYSQSNFNDQVNWLKSLAPNNLTITEDDIISPDGTLSGAKIEYVNNSQDAIFIQNITVVNGEDYVLSIWLKGEQGGEVVNMSLSNSSGGVSGTKDTFTLTDEWVRYKTDIKVADATDRGFKLRIEQVDNPLGATFYAWGAQLENNTFASSYIPTEVNTVTRAIDLVTDNSNIDVTSPKFVLYTELNMEGSLQGFARISINNGDDVNLIRLSTLEAGDGIAVSEHIGGSLVGGSLFKIEYATYGRMLKIAIVSTDLGFDIYVNGALASSRTQGAIDTSSYTQIGFTDGDGDNFSGRVRDLRYYDEQLTESELIELTS
jgi:hypothetical protein